MRYHASMTDDGQAKTRAAYSDPAVVAAYAAQNAARPEVLRHAEAFARMLPGRRVVDIGCGPGQYARVFSDWRYEVVGLDASAAMIAVARSGVPHERGPHFVVADMREIGELFPADTFDGAWLSASLLHIPEAETAGVLGGVRGIVVDRGPVYVSVKLGPQGERLVRETKYGREIERVFTFWERERFCALAERLGFRVERVAEAGGGLTGGEPTRWLHCFLRVGAPIRG